MTGGGDDGEVPVNRTFSWEGTATPRATVALASVTSGTAVPVIGSGMRIRVGRVDATTADLRSHVGSRTCGTRNQRTQLMNLPGRLSPA